MKEITGVGSLIRLILRRDRLLIIAWIAIVALAPIGIAASALGLYPTDEALRVYADESMRTPSAIAMLGVVYSPTLGGIVAWRSGLQSAILIAPASLILVIRHTRTEEEKGRRELLGSTAVGRQAQLAAALIVALGASLAIGALIAIGLAGLGLPIAGAVALGLTAAAAGCLFAAVGGLAAQIAESPGTARGIALAVFGILYVLRAPADLGAASWLAWLSPVGWLRQTRAFAGEQWWVFALLFGLVVALSAAAFQLSAWRDLGAGLLPPRLGPATAAPGLRTPLVLAWRLHRGALLSWAAAFAALGVGLGSVAPSIAGFVDVPGLQDWVIRMGAHDAGEAFVFIIAYVLGQVASAYAITATLQSRSEEAEGRADLVLATSVGRLRWLASHLAFGLLGPAVMMLALGLPIGLIYGSSLGDLSHDFPRLVARILATLPAIWVVVGIASILNGSRPRLAAPVSWGALAVFLALELAWELRLVSPAAFAISPFAWVHWAAPLSIPSLIWLTVVAAVLTAAGLIGFYHRDVG